MQSNTYIDPSKEINNKDLKFKIGDILTISEYKAISVKGYTPNWSGEVFAIKKLKTLCCGDVLLMNWPEKKSLEHSLKKIAKNKSKRFQNWKRNQEKRW